MVSEFYICAHCGKECRADYEPPKVSGTNVIATPKSLKHCEKGQILTRAISKLIGFQEKLADDRWVDARAVWHDF